MFYSIRFFDVLISLLCLIILLPLFIFIIIIIKLTSKGPVIFAQKRVGKDNADFTLYKFRTMYVNSESKRSLTVGNRDSRITPVGYLLRKYKIDELPQLFNVLLSDMSIVGPRPELRKYVDFYSAEQRKILLIKPGITDYASIRYRNENELLATQKDPEGFYINNVLPVKLRLNNLYAAKPGLRIYFIIIFNTLFSVIKRH